MEKWRLLKWGLVGLIGVAGVIGGIGARYCGNRAAQELGEKVYRLNQNCLKFTERYIWEIKRIRDRGRPTIMPTIIIDRVPLATQRQLKGLYDLTISSSRNAD